jgi:hypothetical protein
MSDLVKIIDVPVNVSKYNESATTVSIYTDKVVAQTGNGIREWNFCKYSKIEIVEASFAANNQYAIIFFVTPDEVAHNTKLSRMKFLTDKNCAIAFCSGMFNYEAANKYVHEVGDEINNTFISYLQNNMITQLNKNKDIVYAVKGVRGRFLDVYETKCVITVKAGVGSFLSGNVSDGEKTIYYKDIIGVQFKKSGLQIGYLQLETASTQMNNLNSNFFNENSFTFDSTTVSSEVMTDIVDYVKNKVEAYHGNSNGNTTTLIQQKSVAEELKEFKELLDLGIITVDEFEVRKKRLLEK